MKYKPELVLDSRCVIGEGPLWDAKENLLYFVDLLGNSIYRFSPQENLVELVDCGQNTGSIAFSNKHDLIAALQNGFYYVDIVSETLIPIVDPESDKPNNRFNDGKVGPGGRFFAGTMCKDLDTGYGSLEPRGKLYRLDSDFSYKVIEQETIISNGIAWTADEKTMYYINTPTNTVVAYDYDKATGDVSNKRVVIKVDKGMGGPDGVTIDSEGMLWICHWGGSCVNRWNPKIGKVVDKIDMPVSQPTCCVFGGKDMNELYITSAKINAENELYAGGVFCVKTDVSGLGSYTFDD